MAALKDEYTDLKTVKHSVEHYVRTSEEPRDNEQILEELLFILTKK